MGYKTIGPVSGRRAIQALTADTALTVEDSGKMFLLDAVGEDITIPAAAAANKGVTYKFVMNAKCITSDWSMASAAADIHAIIIAGGAAEAALISAGSADTSVRFELNNADEGDWCEWTSTGTFWIVTGGVHALANCTVA